MRRRRFSGFLLAGAAGFLVDAGMLSLLLELTPLGPLTARPLAILVAMTVAWTINRHLAFGPSQRSLAGEWAAYVGVAAASALLNYAVFAAILLAVPTTPPLAALALASLAAMAASWLGLTRLVFVTTKG